MPLQNLPGKLVIPTRAQRVALYKRAILARVPAANTPPDMRPGGKIDLDARACADVAGSIDANSVTIANGVTRATATGQALYDWATRLGTTAPLPAHGASGACGNPAGASSGTTIFAGDVATHLPTGLRFQCTKTGTYLPGTSANPSSGTPIPMQGIDTGPQTDLPSGSVLNWQSPRPGSSATTVVLIQADGSGLSDGSNQETDDEVRARLDLIAANPPASGNDADYQTTITNSELLGIQQAFTVAAALGPGTSSVMFTLRPGTPGANRIPNAEQLADASVLLGGTMPGSDGIFMCTLVASPTTIVLKIKWSDGADGWTDAITWPPYFSTISLGDGVVAEADASSVLSATQFRLSGPGLTSTTAPQVGQSIAFFDLANLAFRQKKLLTVTAIDGQDYDVTIDTTNGVSDTSYTPSLFQSCGPWSDSLDSIIPAIIAYFDTLGPGEQFANFFDPGLRQKRSPASPQYWPSVITNRILGGAITQQPPQGAQQTQPPVPTVYSTQTVGDAELIEPTAPHATPTGTPGVSSYLLTLGDLIVFPE
jgi:uncharacterized phage protein gp47/JayE